MKKVFLSFAFAALVAGGAVAQTKPVSQVSVQNQQKNGPAMTFAEAEYNFGEIVQGDVVEHTFKFTNTGTQPLVIKDVVVSCGCTTPSWTKEPVMPGKSGTIVAKYDSAGRLGQQKKAITIVSNAAEGQKYVYIVTDIKEKKTAPTANQ